MGCQRRKGMRRYGMGMERGEGTDGNSGNERDGKGREGGK